MSELAAERPAPLDETPPLEPVLTKVGSWTAILFGPDVDRQRRVLVELFERVTPERVGHAVYEARATWTPTGRAVLALGAAAEACGYQHCGLGTAATRGAEPPRTLAWCSSKPFRPAPTAI